MTPHIVLSIAALSAIITWLLVLFMSSSNKRATIRNVVKEIVNTIVLLILVCSVMYLLGAFVTDSWVLHGVLREPNGR